MAYGMIFDIQRFALHDGPGIRTTVFFKGCSNNCGWCHNPESISSGTQLQFFQKRCVNCGCCQAVCPTGAHVLADGVHVFDRSKCSICGVCVSACYTDSLVLVGRRVSVDDVLREIMEDAPYYATSGGGATLSGGEPVLQWSYALELLVALKDKGIHTNIQTAGYYPFECIEPMLPYLDMVMYDVKGISDEIYRMHIHGDRDLILANLLALDATINAPLIVRTPVIEGVNANEGEILAIARYIKQLKHLESYRLIPYHGLGRAKHETLGGAHDNSYATPSGRTIAKLERLAAEHVPVYNFTKGYIGRVDNICEGD